MTLTLTSRQRRNLPEAFPTAFLFKLVNAAVILAFSSSFRSCMEFCMSLTETCPTHDNQENCHLGSLVVRWLDFLTTSKVFTCLSGIAQVTRFRFFQQPLSLFMSNYPFQKNNCVIRIVSEVMTKDESLLTTPKTMIWWPNRLGLQNTPTASLQRDKTPLWNVLDMKLNNLMVRVY